MGDFVLPFDLSYEVDAWGRIRHTVEAARASAQASAADLETVRLSMHAELAFDYFQLRGLDAQKKLLDSTVSRLSESSGFDHQPLQRRPGRQGGGDAG